MVRQAHHERNLEPFVLSLSKDERPSFFSTLLIQGIALFNDLLMLAV